MTDTRRNSPKRKRKHEEETDDLRAKKQNADATIEIHDLPDEMLIYILSCMPLKDAVRTSVLSHRFRYLWMYTFGKLEFDDRCDRGIQLQFGDKRAGAVIERKKFKTRVNRVLKLHQGGRVDSLVIRFTNLRLRARSSDIDSWIHFAVQKEVNEFELNLSVENGFHCGYKFPNVAKLLSRSKSSVFGSLRSLRLVDVDVEDEVVRYFLASCPCIEHLCIRASNATKNLEVADPLPNLKDLEVSDCCNLESLEIFATNLVSCTYQGREIGSPFKKTPNLTELTLGGEYCQSFIFEPNKHSSYSAQLVKLVLNLKTITPARTNVPRDLPQLYSLEQLELNTVMELEKSLLFFLSLIKACPNLHEFKIKIVYWVIDCNLLPSEVVFVSRLPFPEVTPAKAKRFQHKNLKVIELCGFIGSRSEAMFIRRLFKVAPLVDKVLFNTPSVYYRFHPLIDVPASEGIKPRWVDPSRRDYAKLWAMELKNKISPPNINFDIL